MAIVSKISTTPVRPSAPRNSSPKLRVGQIGIGGDGGIRTLDRALQPYNGLANRRLQPLGHVSIAQIWRSRRTARRHMPEPPTLGKYDARDRMRNPFRGEGGALFSSRLSSGYGAATKPVASICVWKLFVGHLSMNSGASFTTCAAPLLFVHEMKLNSVKRLAQARIEVILSSRVLKFFVVLLRSCKIINELSQPSRLIFQFFSLERKLVGRRIHVSAEEMVARPGAVAARLDRDELARNAARREGDRRALRCGDRQGRRQSVSGWRGRARRLAWRTDFRGWPTRRGGGRRAGGIWRAGGRGRPCSGPRRQTLCVARRARRAEIDAVRLYAVAGRARRHTRRSEKSFPAGANRRTP